MLSVISFTMKMFFLRGPAVAMLALLWLSGFWVPRSPAADFPGEALIDVASGLKSGDVTFISSPIDIGEIPALFDGDVKTIARSKQINPFELILMFPKPQTMTRMRLLYGGAPLPLHRWKVYSANSLQDMQGKKDSYRAIVGGHTDKGDAWSQVKFATPVSATVWRVELEEIKGDNFVHWHELECYEPAAASGAAVKNPANGTPAPKPNSVELTWTTRSGQTLTAKFQALEGDSVVLSVKGTTMKMPLGSLSDESRTLAQKLGEAAKAASH